MFGHFDPTFSLNIFRLSWIGLKRKESFFSLLFWTVPNIFSSGGPLHSGKHDLVSVVRKIPKMTPTPHALQVGRYEKPMLHLSFSPIQTHLRREVAFTRVWALSKPFMAHLHDDENATFLR